METKSTGRQALEVVDGREAGSGSSKVRSSPYAGPLRPPGARLTLALALVPGAAGPRSRAGQPPAGQPAPRIPPDNCAPNG